MFSFEVDNGVETVISNNHNHIKFFGYTVDFELIANILIGVALVAAKVFEFVQWEWWVILLPFYVRGAMMLAAVVLIVAVLAPLCLAMVVIDYVITSIRGK